MLLIAASKRLDSFEFSFPQNHGLVLAQTVGCANEAVNLKAPELSGAVNKNFVKTRAKFRDDLRSDILQMVGCRAGLSVAG
jgi:hypothetical protein